MTDRKSFGNILKLLRNNKGLSQRQLAKKLNVAPSTLAMYELNKREPDYETLGKIADFFDVNTDYLLGRSANPYPIEKIAQESSNYYFRNLPEEAKKTLDDFIEYIHIKYSKDKKK
jgi:transcriptional regulator with XRE-family HTH domain